MAIRLVEPGEEADDLTLIERTLAGDGAAYGVLVGRYQRRIYGVALAIVRDEAEADAITQDVFVLAYTSLARFEQRSGMETWLTRIAINRSRDSLRRRRFVSLFVRDDGDGEERAAIEPADERPGPDRELAASQLRAAIERAERKLSAQQQLIFRLRHYDDLPLEEIAVLLRLHPGTVRAHLFRAVRKVRAELASWRNDRTGEHHEPARQ